MVTIMRDKSNESVVVIGGGIAGIQAASELGAMGFHVYLLEKEPSIGGRMARLNRIFPTNESAISILEPKMQALSSSGSKNVELITYAEIVDIRGSAGDFEITIERKPRYVDMNKCTGCQRCTEVCPVELPDGYNENLGTRKAIYIPHARAVPRCAVVDMENCLRFYANGGESEKCHACIDACEYNAIDFTPQPEPVEKRIEKLRAGAVIVAVGSATYDPEPDNDYGYGLLDDVITTMEFERLTAPDGPTGGTLIRPSDCREPMRVGFINCVGSRDVRKNVYCSGGVCCMENIKNAILLKEKRPDVRCYIFYIDIRAVFRGYEEYYTRARELGIRFIRGRPGEVMKNEAGNLVIRVEDTMKGVVRNIEVELVVLGTGFVPGADIERLAEMLNIPVADDGLFQERHSRAGPVDTDRGGIFIAGTAAGPKDIAFALIQGSSAAARAASTLFSLPSPGRHHPQ